MKKLSDTIFGQLYNNSTLTKWPFKYRKLNRESPPMEYFFTKAVSWALLEKIIYGSRSSHQRCSVKKGVVRNFAKFTGKDLFQGLFFNRGTLAQLFSCQFCKIFMNTFLQNTSGGCFYNFCWRMEYFFTELSAEHYWKKEFMAGVFG